MVKTNIKGPPRERRTKVVKPPEEPQATHNLDKEKRTGTSQLKLNIDPSVKREFKAYAAEHEISMSSLFERMFEEYRDKH